MSLRKKILLGYSLVLILLVVVLVWSILRILALGRAGEAILWHNYRSIVSVIHMTEALEGEREGLLLWMALGPPAASSREQEAQFYQWLGRAKDNITETGEKELLSAIDREYTGLLEEMGRVRSLPSGRAGEAAELYHQKVLPRFDRLIASLQNVQTVNEKAMYRASEAASDLARSATWSTALVGGTGLLFGLLFSLFLSTRLTRPIVRLAEALRRIAQGDYSAQVPIETRDDLGRLSLEFNEMAAKLADFHHMNIDRIILEKSKNEAVLRAIEDGLVLVGPDLRVMGLNPSAQRILGLGVLSPDEPLHLLEAIKDERIADRIRETIRRGAAAGASTEADPPLSLAFSSRERHYQVVITRMEGLGEGRWGAVVMLRDITRLWEMDRMKSEFVLAASHELRTPLTSIGMSIDLLMESVSPRLEARERELLAAAHEEVNRLKELVTNLLDLSKLEAGKIEMDFEAVAPASLSDRIAGIFQRQFEEKQIRFSADFPKGLPLVWADANKITWVITNIVSNASRYVPQGGHIRLSAQAVRDRVHVSVADDGPGIPLEYQSKIFEKFVQVKDVRASSGSGLGLAICKEIVKAHGGAIWVDSTPGQGSVFTFTLPVVR